MNTSTLLRAFLPALSFGAATPALATIAVTTVAAVASLTTSAAACADERAWYIGLSSDTVSVNVQRSNDLFDSEAYDYGSSSSGSSVFGGLRVNRFLAVEAGVQRRDSLRWTESFAQIPGISGFLDSDVTFGARVHQVLVAGILPFRKRWEAYVKGGIASYQLSGMQTITDEVTGAPSVRHVSTRGHDYPLGFGVGATLREHWHLFFDISGFDIPKSFVGARGTSAWLSSYSLGIQYRFTRRSEHTTATATSSAERTPSPARLVSNW